MEVGDLVAGDAGDEPPELRGIAGQPGRRERLTEDGLREVLLPTGWVDVKVCAVDADWSGLKFLRRKT